MNRYQMHLIAFAGVAAISCVVSGCGGSGPETSSPAPSIPIAQAPTPKPFSAPVQESGVPQVLLTKVRLRPWTNSNGVRVQMVLLNWRNVGNVPIGSVNANIRAYDSSGQLLENSVDNYCIFAVGRHDERIPVGKSYIEPIGDGFALIPAFGHADHVTATISRCSGDADEDLM